MGMAIEAAQPRFAGLGGSALQGNRDLGWGFQTPRAMATHPPGCHNQHRIEALCRVHAAEVGICLNALCS